MKESLSEYKSGDKILSYSTENNKFKWLTIKTNNSKKCGPILITFEEKEEEEIFMFNKTCFKIEAIASIYRAIGINKEAIIRVLKNQGTMYVTAEVPELKEEQKNETGGII